MSYTHSTLVNTLEHPYGTYEPEKVPGVTLHIYNTPGGRLQLRGHTEKQFALVCLKSLSDVCKRLSEIYPAGLALASFTDSRVKFRIEFTCWDVFEKLIVPFLEKCGLEGVIEPRTADCSYGGEMWVTLKFPKATRHVMHTVYVGASYANPKRKISVERLAELLDAMTDTLEDRRRHE